MFEPLRMQPIPVAAGAVTVVALLAAGVLLPKSSREMLRETAFDLVLAADQRLLPAAARLRGSPVIVVDIDRRSLEAVGSWPWPRATMARLIDSIAAAKPAAAAIDILFAGHDSRPPLPRHRGTLIAGDEPGAPADKPADGDALLAQAVSRLPLALGFVLDPDANDSLPQAPLATRGSPSFDELWSAAGADAPPRLLTEKASGLGALSLPANPDGIVRHVPLLVAVGGYVLPGIALETIRIAHGASVYVVQSPPPILTIGDLRIPFPADGFLRLLPITPERRAARTISAIDVLERKDGVARLAGAITLVGGSAPELGGLRATVNDPLTPSVHIHADAVEQIATGRFPRAIGGTSTTQLLLVAMLGTLALCAGVALPPVLGALAVVMLVLLAWVAAVAGSILTDRLVDPLTPSAAAATVFIVASVTSFAMAHRREVLVRRRFEQRLAPAVVQRIVERPGLIKLGAERREVTALFTDVEGFTAMTHRADPRELIAMLDIYFESISKLIVEHGGMVDKIVGDAVHAIFNAPLDLDHHPRRAVECAVAIRAWAESYRRSSVPAALGLGRTRIGIETGQAIVGDVGLQSKLDYTAHGDAVNAAAYFEAANKELGSAICVGPAAAARCDAGMLRPLGTTSVPGRDEPAAVFEPWPVDAPPEWRERFRIAFGLIDRDPTHAAMLFEKLADECESDLVVRAMAQRCGADRR
jgi:adenylate cyclase